MARPDPTIEATIRAQIVRAGKLDPEEVGPDTELVRELGMSSLELLDVLAFAEQTYDITIADEELVSLTTLRRMVAKVEALTAGKDRA